MWPFKTLKQNSSWPMQPFVVQFAAAVLAAPEAERPQIAAKVIERCIRMAARLAVEFDMPVDSFLELAKTWHAKETAAAPVTTAALFGDKEKLDA